MEHQNDPDFDIEMDSRVLHSAAPVENDETQQSNHPQNTSNREMTDSLSPNLNTNEDSKSPLQQKDCSRPVPKVRSKVSLLGSLSSSVTNDLNLISEEEEQRSRPKPVPRQRNIKMKAVLQTENDNQAIEVTNMSSQHPARNLSLDDNTLVSKQTSSTEDTGGMVSEPTENAEQTFSSDNSSNECSSVEDFDIASRMNGALKHHGLIQSTIDVTGEQSHTVRKCFLPIISSNLNDLYLELIQGASNVKDKEIYVESIPKTGQTAEIPIPIPTFLQNACCSSNSDTESFHTPTSDDDTCVHQEYLESKKKQKESDDYHDVVLPEKVWENASVEPTKKKNDSGDDNDVSPKSNWKSRSLEPKERQDKPDDDDDHDASPKSNWKSKSLKPNKQTKSDDDDDDDDLPKKNHAENIQIGNKNVQLICQRMNQSATRNMQIGSRNVMINLRFQRLGSYKFEEKEENIFHLEQDKEVVYIKIKRFERKYTKTISESEYDKLPIPGRRKSRSTSKAFRCKMNPYMEPDRESLGSRRCNRIIEEIRFTELDPIEHEDKHNVSEAETINRIIEENGVLFECIDKEVDVQTVTPSNDTIKDLNNAYMNGDIDSIFETLCSVENISYFLQQGGDNFDVELIGNEVDEEIYHEAVDIDEIAEDCIDDDYDMPANWILTTHIYQKHDKKHKIPEVAPDQYSRDSLYSTVETLEEKVWCQANKTTSGGNKTTSGGNFTYESSFPKTGDMSKIISDDPDYDCPDSLSIHIGEACGKDFYAVPLKKSTKPTMSNSSTRNGCLYNGPMTSTESLSNTDTRTTNTTKSPFLREKALPRGYLTLTESYDCEEGRGNFYRSISPSLKYQTPIPPPRPPDKPDEVKVEQSRFSPSLSARSSPLGREFSSLAQSPPLPKRNLRPNLTSKADRPMQPLPQKKCVKQLQAKDCTIGRTKSSEFSTNTKALTEGNEVQFKVLEDMHQYKRRLLSEGHGRYLSDSDDDAPPVPPRPRAGKVLSEKDQSPGPLPNSAIPKTSSPVQPHLRVVRNDAHFGQYGQHNGNTLPPHATVNKIYADGLKSSSHTLLGSARDQDLNPRAFSPSRNPSCTENKFKRTTDGLETLNDFGNSRNRSENIYTQDPFQTSSHLNKEAISERCSNSSYVTPNPTNHSTERTRRIRNKPAEASCDDRSLQEIASSRLWYHENLDRCVANQMLVSLSINGAFLVRDASSSTQSNHAYTLETYYAGNVYKFQISKEKGEFFFNGFPNRAFRTLDDMVEAMMTYGMEVQDESAEWIHISLFLPWRICMEKKAEK